MIKRTSGNAEQHGFPEGTLVSKQSPVAWLLWVIPWGIAGVAFFSFGQWFLGIFTFVLGVIGAFPALSRWRNTLYIVTNDAFVLQRGHAAGSRQISIPATELREIRERSGLLGNILAYRVIDVVLAQGKFALGFMPIGTGFAERLEQVRLANPPKLGQETSVDQDSDTDADEEWAETVWLILEQVKPLLATFDETAFSNPPLAHSAMDAEPELRKTLQKLVQLPSPISGEARRGHESLCSSIKSYIDAAVSARRYVEKSASGLGERARTETGVAKRAAQFRLDQDLEDLQKHAKSGNLELIKAISYLGSK